METNPSLGLIALARRAADRIAHRWRRPSAIARLRRAAAPRSVLVVCHGNLCRSPYAAATLRRHLEARGLAVAVDSAGFFSPQRRPPSEAIDTAAVRGIDLSSHRSQAISRELIDAADLIVVMTPEQLTAVEARRGAPARLAVVLGDLDPEAVPEREIADPFGSRRSVFEDCYSRIDRCVEELAKALFDARKS